MNICFDFTAYSSLHESLREVINLFHKSYQYLVEDEATGSTKEINDLYYEYIRKEFGLNSSMVQRLIGAYVYNTKHDKHMSRNVALYCSRTLSFSKNELSIWTLDGKKTIPTPTNKKELLKQCKFKRALLKHVGDKVYEIIIKVEQPIEVHWEHPEY